MIAWIYKDINMTVEKQNLKFPKCFSDILCCLFFQNMVKR